MIFRRINFFRGLFMTAEDWKTEQNYHIEKCRLHNRTFHTPGIVTGNDDELRESLKVGATEAGAVLVLPGYAVDGLGRDLRLFDAKELVIASGTGPQVAKEIYIYITFEEEKVEPRENRLDPAHRDDAIIEERPKVAWTDEAPDNHQKIELARIHWQPGRRIAQDHIDTSHVRHAGARHADFGPHEILSDTAIVPPDSKERIVEIKSFTDQRMAARVLFIANVYPIEKSEETARVRWRIESCLTRQEEVSYQLFLQGVGTTKPVRVRYEVYQLITAH